MIQRTLPLLLLPCADTLLGGYSKLHLPPKDAPRPAGNTISTEAHAIIVSEIEVRTGV